MANEIYSSSYWGNGVCDNSIDWGVVYKDYAGCTPSFNNTYSLAFDGVDDKITITEVDYSGAFTFSFWVKPTINGTFVMGLNSGFGHFVWLRTDVIIRLRINGVQYEFTESGGNNIVLNQWQNIIITRDSSNNINCYRNGVAFGGSSTLSGTFKVDSIGGGMNLNTWDFTGNLDEVAFWNNDQTANISTISTSPVVDLTSLNPLAWYRMGDNGTYKSTQWLIPNNENKTKFSNYSFEYDGVDDFIDTGSSTLSGETALSISAWVYPTAYGDATAPSFVSTDAASPRAFYLGLFNGTNFRFSLSTNGTSLTSLDTATSTVDLNTWQHILVTWDQVNLKLYKNGVLLKTVATTSSSNGTFTTTNDLLIGARRSSAGFFEGNIDEVAIWNSVQDASLIYNSGVPSDISSLSPVGYWRSENSTFLTNWTVTDNGSGSATGTSANMTIEDRVGDASNSSNNAVSFNQVEADRKTDVPT